MALTQATKTELYRFFAIAFDAAPGVVYMDQLAEAVDAGMTVPEIVDVFTQKPQFTSVYPTWYDNEQFATKLVENIVGDSASSAAKAEHLNQPSHRGVVDHEAQFGNGHAEVGVLRRTADIARDRQLHSQAHAGPRDGSNSWNWQVGELLQDLTKSVSEDRVLKFLQICSGAEVTLGPSQNQTTGRIEARLAQAVSKFLEGLEVDRVASLWPIDGNDRNLRLTGVVNGHADSGLGDHDDQISFGDLVIWRNMN